MLKINWENHTNIVCDIERHVDKDVVKCSAEYKDGNVAHILEVGQPFQFGEIKAKLSLIKYNTSNIKVYYEFINTKEGF